VPLVADPQIQETSTGGEATSGSISSPFNIRDQFSSAPSVVDPEGPTTIPLPKNTVHDAILLLSLVIMLVWPWIFLGTVWGPKGIQMGNRAAKVVTDHPHATSFFVTFIGNIVNLVVSILFSFSIIRLAQEKVVGEKDITIFDVSLVLGSPVPRLEKNRDQTGP